MGSYEVSKKLEKVEKAGEAKEKRVAGERW
jgi:hypothetical protein